MSDFTLGLGALTYSATWPDALATARLADDLGYDQLFTADHLFATGGDPNQGFFEGWTTLAAFAQATRQVDLGLLVGGNPFRNPGVDCIYIGPGDLALGLGLDWDDSTWNPTQAKSHDDAIRTIHAAAKKRGIATGIHAGNGAASAKYIEMGLLMLTAVTDLGVITVHGREEVAKARAAMPAAARAKVMAPGGAASVL